MSVASSSDRSKHSTAHKVQGALRGPLGRLRTTPPTLYREGNRAEYPIIHLNAPDINAKSKFPENLFFTTKYAKNNTFSKKKLLKNLLCERHQKVYLMVIYTKAFIRTI